MTPKDQQIVNQLEENFLAWSKSRREGDENKEESLIDLTAHALAEADNPLEAIMAFIERKEDIFERWQADCQAETRH